jgi:hypothetical protein
MTLYKKSYRQVKHSKKIPGIAKKNIFKFFTEFQAFKFPDKDTVHFNCGILLCKGECPKECDGNQKPFKPLARLEIFNSLKVIAPQIESIDRPQMEEKRAASSGEY